MKPMQTYLAMFLLFAVLQGCLAVPRIDSVEDGIAVGYLASESAYEATLSAVNQEWISLEEGRRVRDNIDTALGQLDEASAFLVNDDPASAEDALAMAEKVLAMVQRMLQEVEQ